MVRHRIINALILLFSLGVAVFFFRALFIMLALGKTEPMTVSPESPGGVHVMLLLPPGEDPFFRDLLKGARKAASDYQLGLEIQRPHSMEDYLAVARISQVDGLALYVTDEQALVPGIDRLSVENIPVITLESDAPASRRLCYVGSNGFRIGQRAGELIMERQSGEIRAALIRSSRLFEKASRGEIIYYGIQAAISGGDNRIVDNVLSETGILSAEETARRVMLRNPGLNVIFCTSMIDTIAAVQALRKYRPRRDIRILGYGSHRIIREGMEEGQVAGTIRRDGFTTGYEGIQILFDALEDRYVPSARYIDFRIDLPGRGRP